MSTSPSLPPSFPPSLSFSPSGVEGLKGGRGYKMRQGSCKVSCIIHCYISGARFFHPLSLSLYFILKYLSLYLFSGFGFCEYGDPESTLRALRILHDFKLGEKNLVVKVDSKTRTDLLKYVLKKKHKNEEETVDEEEVRLPLSG